MICFTIMVESMDTALAKRKAICKLRKVDKVEVNFQRQFFLAL